MEQAGHPDHCDAIPWVSLRLFAERGAQCVSVVPLRREAEGTGHTEAVMEAAA